MRDIQNGKSAQSAFAFKLSAFGSGFLDGFASMVRVLPTTPHHRSTRTAGLRNKTDWQAIRADFASVFPRVNAHRDK